MAQLLAILPTVEDWPNTPQGQWFWSTLFPTFDVCRQLGETERLWDKYCELRPKIIDLEASLAEEWFSPELLSVLRAENLRTELKEKRNMVVCQVKAQIVGYLRDGHSVR